MNRDRSLSDREITKFTGMPCYVYSELERLVHLPRTPFCLLYELKPSHGHWCLVHDTFDTYGEPCIEMFDSYGVFPDSELNWVNPDFRKVSGQLHTKLIRLLLNSGKNVAYNHECVQGPKSCTCGRWCILRHVHRNMCVEDFVKTIKAEANKEKISLDELAIRSVPL